MRHLCNASQVLDHVSILCAVSFFSRTQKEIIVAVNCNYIGGNILAGQSEERGDYHG